MLRHPQNSGLQMDQVTRLYVPPFFVGDLGGLGRVTTSYWRWMAEIAISEDPRPPVQLSSQPAPIISRVKGFDTSKNVFKGEWQAEKVL